MESQVVRGCWRVPTSMMRGSNMFIMVLTVIPFGIHTKPDRMTRGLMVAVV
jgi:hypothetical protein